MGASYIPQNKVFAVCTYQLSPDPQKFSFNEPRPTLYYQNDQQPVLNVEDKNLMKPFTCKSPANLAGTLLAFGAGLAIGALVFLSGPVGWIAIGIGAAIFVGGAVATIAAVKHTCTDPLSSGHWFLAHNSVKIDGASAITRLSILKCGNSGILSPFFDEATAIAAANSIAKKNRWELGINVVASFGAGLFLPSAFGGWASASIGGKIWLAGGRFIFGFAAFSGINYAIRGGVRFTNENIGSVSDNITYDNMNNHTEFVIDSEGNTQELNIDDNSLFSQPSKPDDFIQDSDDIINITRIGDGKFKITVLSKLSGIISSYNIYENDKSFQQQIEKLEGLNRQQLRTNPLAKQLLNDLNNGKYSDWKNNTSNYNPRRMNPSMIDDGRRIMANNVRNSLKNLSSNSFQVFLFLIPFIGTLISENVRKNLAEELANDLNANLNGSNLIANNPVD